jgi:hemerythrin
VDDLKAQLDAGEKINAMGLYNFLTRWVKHHILHVDMKLALALKLSNS